MWQFWLLASGVFLIIEIFTIGFLVFWLAIGSLVAMVTSFFIQSILIQTTVFVISSTILIFATRPLVNKILKKDSVHTNVYSIIGKEAIVTEEINWNNNSGQIKCGSEIWSAKTDEQINIPKGSKVQITHIEGVKACVTPVKVITTN